MKKKPSGSVRKKVNDGSLEHIQSLESQRIFNERLLDLVGRLVVAIEVITVDFHRATKFEPIIKEETPPPGGLPTNIFNW